MIAFSDLRTLGLVALAAALLPATAMAQIQTYYHAGAWDAFSGRNEQGGAVCGVGNTNPANNRRVTIRFDIGGSATAISASKPDWSIPDNTPVTVVTQIGLNTPTTLQATGQGHSITWTLDPGAMQGFDQQFRNASLMTLTFPDGNEPPWSVSLNGSSAISQTMARCVRDLTRQVQAAQPVGGGTGTAPANPNATQPFMAPYTGPSTAAPPLPDATSSAGQPSAAPAAGSPQPATPTPLH